MRKIIHFFIGITLMAIIFLSLMVSGAIYDTGAKTKIETFFFQTNDSYDKRPGVPVSPADFGVNRMRDMLISKYITELFYVTPDMIDLQRRITGKTALVRMSTLNVFNKWSSDVLPDIEALATKHVLRTVSLISAEEQKNSKYWRIIYETKTWSVSNNFTVVPQTSRGVVYLSFVYEPGLREAVRGVDLLEYLEENPDPSAAFRFVVDDIVFQD